MKTIQTIISRILISLLFGAVGFFVAWLVMRGIENGIFARWQSLGIAPDGARRFVSYQIGSGRDTDNLYVETLSRRIFLYYSDSKNWQETTNIPADLGMAQECDLSYVRMQRLVSRLSQPVEGCIERTWSWEWASDRDIFVILADGSVWKLRDYTSLGTGLSITCGLPILAVIIGWGMVWVSRRKRI